MNNKFFVKSFDDIEEGGLYKFTTYWHCFFDIKNPSIDTDITTENKTFLVLEIEPHRIETDKPWEYPIKVFCLDDNQEYIVLFDSDKTPEEPIQIIFNSKIMQQRV